MGRTSDALERVKTLVEPVLAREGYELVEAELTSDRGRHILRLFIDTVPPGTETHGVGIEDCSRVSRVVSDLLDVEDLVAGQYHLEVSSPGLFRPLTKASHFDRAMGARVKVKTFEKMGDRKVFTGILRRREEDAVVVDVDGREFRLELDKIAKANLEPELFAGGASAR